MKALLDRVYRGVVFRRRLGGRCGLHCGRWVAGWLDLLKKNNNEHKYSRFACRLIRQEALLFDISMRCERLGMRRRASAGGSAAGDLNGSHQNVTGGGLGEHLGIRPVPPEAPQTAVASKKDNANAALLEYLCCGEHELAAKDDIEHSAGWLGRVRESER